MPDKFNRLIEVAEDADREELEIFQDTKDACEKAFKDDPAEAKANKSNLDAARDALTECVARLWPVYFPEKQQAPAESEKRFKTGEEMKECLARAGYPCGKSKLLAAKNKYQQMTVQEDSTVLESDLIAYAKKYVAYRGDPAAVMDMNQRRKVKGEADKIEKQNRLLDYELGIKDDMYTLTAEVELQTSAHKIVYDQEVRNMHLTQALAWIELVRGDPNLEAEFIAAMARKFDEVNNQMAKMGQFQVVFEAADIEKA
ncbi:MAG: hypothetical protein JRF53_00635 [Deltaproteobacteria bacterium]|nr:hypothetical protein [Deltaproteobacteria bacterium]